MVVSRLKSTTAAAYLKPTLHGHFSFDLSHWLVRHVRRRVGHRRDWFHAPAGAGRFGDCDVHRAAGAKAAAALGGSFKAQSGACEYCIFIQL